MRALQLLAIALLATVAWADGIPNFQYFYSCDSGLVDCGGFSIHYSVPIDFPQQQLFTYDDSAPPALGYPIEIAGLPSASGGSFQVTASNSIGEAIGTIAIFGQIPQSSPMGLVANGNLYDLGGDNTQGFGRQFWPVDINDNGIWLAQSSDEGPGFTIGIGVYEAFEVFDDFYPLVLNNTTVNLGGALGINDQDQVLITTDTGQEGVLSPFAVAGPSPVPEPSTALLLLGALLFCRTVSRRAHP